MNTFKTNKGITLVALIITIIVLLILTVVAISSITDQGLFTKSQEAVNKYEEKREEEEGKLAEYASEIDKYLQTDKKYIGIINGDEVILVLSPNNEMTITADGTILANKMKPQEIPAPEGFPNSENYSKFYKSTVNGIEMICGMSKDGKTITILGMGDLTLVGKYETPIVYRVIDASYNFEVTIIILSNTEAIEYAKQGEYSAAEKGSIVPYSQITSNNIIINKYGKEYTKAIVGEDGSVSYVYCSADDVWLATGTVNSKLEISNTKLELINISEDEINAIIQKANQ